jgi:hypothetical protein
MTALLFSSGMQRVENQVRQMISELVDGLEVFRSVNSLSRRFDQPRGDIDLMIFTIADHHFLYELLAIKDRMYDLPIILILPDSNRETVLAGHTFHPRFITDTESGLDVLFSVLDKMVKTRMKERLSMERSMANQTA